MILRDLEKTTCERCGANLSVGVQFTHDNREIIVGRECAKHYGITWTAKVGPLADDAEMFARAVEIFHYHNRPPYHWLNGWDYCAQVKNALGAIAWNKARDFAWNKKP